MKARTLVLGATGFVGRHLVKALNSTDWAEPIAASRRQGIGLRRVDAADPASLAAALADVDGVVNCVAGVPATIVANARALAAALAARGAPLPVVHFSSMAVYGAAEGRIDEAAALDAASSYGHAKVESERLLAALPSLTILRPGCIYGGGSPQWSARIAQLLRARRLGDLGAAGDGCSNLVHIDDVVQAALAALRKPAAGAQAYNLAMADAPRWNEYFVAYARILGVTPVERIGARRLALETKLWAPALKIAGIAGRKLGGVKVPPPLPSSLARLWQQDIRLDARRAELAFDMTWTPWRVALQAEAFVAASSRAD
ncbi:SDR family oxidoreductase [Paraburkholderia sp. CNPSo 3272]|uniref:NAD-dependent epimerase/dehydratase family protein n=1 Tax=Paraburkholderia sp. CNPSo 3272 TaxID=2940931 RepID=UPI0020B70237|nr:SDR family oxidoreductase [Paraburkholderia sp. CNPSo 3272]MCP3726482.1 SDR family oxidoreductase [Paraburkholderia sp. CNPSo 3272]